MSQLTLNGDTSNFIAVATPTSISASYTVTLPSASPTANGAYLSATTAGIASWSTLCSATYATIVGYTTTATAGTTTTLTSSSTLNQFFTGSSAQTIVMPDVTTLALGWTFHISNNSTGTLTVNSSGSNLISTVLPGTSLQLVCIAITGTTAASWDYELAGFTTPTGTGNVVLATNPSITKPTITNYVETYYTVSGFTSTVTLDLANGTVQSLTLVSATALTITLPSAATQSQSFILMIRQPASGTATTATFAASPPVKWSGGTAPTITATLSRMDIITFVSDGTNWYGSFVQNFTP